jgi:hypothetical protein
MLKKLSDITEFYAFYRIFESFAAQNSWLFNKFRVILSTESIGFNEYKH